MSKIAISLKSPILFQSTNPTAQIEIQVLAGVPRNCTELLYSFLRLLAFVGKYSSHLSEILTERERLLVFLRLSSGLHAPHAGPALLIGLAIKWSQQLKNSSMEARD